jgi:hypothetical protein
MTSPPDTWTNNIFVGLSYPFGSYHSTGGAGGAAGYPDPSQVTEVGDHLYATRAAWVAAGGSSQTFPSPLGCAGTIGNMAIP